MLVRSAIVAALLSAEAFGASGVQPRDACPFVGSTYLAQGTLDQSSLKYRLVVDALPRTAEGSAVATLWRFQTINRQGHKLSELRMYYSCGNGTGPCSVSPPHRPGPDGGLYSEVVQLNKDFSLATAYRAPYAIILPGFGQADWTFTRRDLSAPDFTFFTPARIAPDLQQRQVWLLSACGGRVRDG